MRAKKVQEFKREDPYSTLGIGHTPEQALKAIREGKWVILRVKEDHEGIFKKGNILWVIEVEEKTYEEDKVLVITFHLFENMEIYKFVSSKKGFRGEGDWYRSLAFYESSFSSLFDFIGIKDK